MRAFVVHNKSVDISDRVDQVVKDAGYILPQEDGIIKGAKSVSEIIDRVISESDLIVVILNKSFLASKIGDLFLRALTISSDFGEEKKRVIFFVTEVVRIPFDLEKFETVLAHKDLEKGLKHFERIINRPISEDQSSDGPILQQASSFEAHKNELIAAHRDGTLTLVCGAGISVGAKLPDWETLLDRLLKILTKEFSGKKESPKFDLSKLKNNSALVLGQYIKNTLDDKFLSYVHSALYETADVETDLIRAIKNLARPKRNAKSLDSIINFNFDDILERSFGKEIEHRSIYSEGQIHSPSEIPIFHVHGYLPKGAKIPSNPGIVFSEDAYHDQFIDPFGWANLTQLNRYSQNTCLFVGLSLTDPNLRRLLDVSKRKNPSEKRRHTIVVKRTGLGDADRIIDNLRSTDAGILGINTIMVDDYSDIPPLLNSIAAA